MTTDSRGQDAALGALLGTALGDALGAPFEGRRRVDPSEVDALAAADVPLRWTDDTHMMLALAASLLDHAGRVEPDGLGDAFAVAYHAEPWRGYGAGPPQVFALAASGVGYLDAAASLFGGEGSLGNGGAMRCAPSAVIGFPDLSSTAAVASQQAAVTHAHPEGIDGAVLLAGAVHVAIATDPAAPLVLHDLEPVRGHLRSAAMRDALAALLAADDRRAAVRFGTSTIARESVPAAITVAFGAADDLLDAIRAAVGLGGDTDTVAAMAGAIVGAHLGGGAVPPALLDRLEARDRITALATALAEL